MMKAADAVVEFWLETAPNKRPQGIRYVSFLQFRRKGYSPSELLHSNEHRAQGIGMNRNLSTESADDNRNSNPHMLMLTIVNEQLKHVHPYIPIHR